MNLPPIQDPGLRRIAATFVALVVSYLPFAFRWFPAWVSDSSPPTTTEGFIGRVMLTLVVVSFFHVIWLLPACAILQQVMIQRRWRGARAAVSVGAVGALVAVASLFPVLPFPDETWLSFWLRRLPAASEAVLFVITWVITIDQTTPPEMCAE